MSLYSSLKLLIIFGFLLIKVFGSLLAGFIYQYYYGGGDTFNFYIIITNFWEGFWDDPVAGWELFNLEANDLWDWTPEKDMHLFHALADELIPYNNSQIAYDTFISNGSENINLYLLPEEYGGHGEAALYCLLAAYQITEDEYKNIRNLGDLNNDFIINIQDILIMIGFILNADELNHLDLWLSDFDSNQIINVQDIILIIDKILRN